MTRRIAALALWAYFAWYLAAMIASVIGGPAIAGPIAAVLTAALGIVGWARSRRAERRPAPQAELQPTR
jgi:hypothetical protein